MSPTTLRLSSWLVCVAVISAWSLPSSSSAGEPTPTAPARRGPESSGPAASPARGTSDYVEGIDALDAGDWKRAVASLSRALQADGDNSDYLRARGVAYTLAESFPEALADLQRALKLRPTDREAKLWLAAAYRMSGDPGKGAQHFSIGGEVPADYADMVYNRMAMDYWSSRYQGGYVDRKTHRRVEAKEPVKILFPEAAAQYAKLHRPAGPAAFQLVMARVKANIERSDFAAAARDLRSLRQANLDDPQVVASTAMWLLGVGNAPGARQEYTRALTSQPFWIEGYLGRAQASAMLGDPRRANADLEVAARLGAAPVQPLKQRISSLLNRTSSADPTARFDQAVDSGASWDALVDAALDMHRWSNVHRHRYDEAYQDRIRVLHEAIRAEPKNPDRHEMLARFLYNHYRVPRLWNGPRGQGEQVRPQSKGDMQRELGQALQLVDEALRLDGRHVSAIGTKAWLLYTQGNAAAAGSLADKGLALEPKEVRLLRLKAQLLLEAAAALEAQAAALRSGRTETTTERRSDGIYEVRRHYPPTAAQLAEAQALERQAAEYRRAAEQAAQAAKVVEQQTIPALISQGDTAARSGDLKAARRAYRQALLYQPDHAEAQGKFAGVCQRLGEELNHTVFALLAQPMQHTTAASELKAGWETATRTAWTAAGEALDRAARLDSVDARVPAYRSVVAQGRADPAHAARLRQAALALEEARARLMGTSFLPPAQQVLDPDDIGLTLVVRLQAGGAAGQTGAYQQALDLSRQNLNLEARLAKEDLFRLLPSAMLPDPSGDPGTVPEAPSVASMLAWSRLGAGRSMMALKRMDEAEREFQAVLDYSSTWPATSPGRNTLNVAVSWASLGMAQAAVAAGRWDRAHQILNTGEGWPFGLPADLSTELKSLRDQVAKARFQQQSDVLKADQQLSPRELQKRSIQQTIDSLEKQRADYQAELAKPNLSETDRRYMSQSVQQLDRMIAQRKQALERLEQAPDAGGRVPDPGGRFPRGQR